MQKRAHLFQDTFWNRKRVEAGMKNSDLAELFHVSDSTVSTWIIGKVMPADYIIHKMCDLFDVEYSVGHSEFFKAHRDYVELARTGAKQKLSYETTPQAEGVQGSIISAYANDVFKLVYGNIPYEAFTAFVNACATKDTGAALSAIYGKVDYISFKKIADVVSGGSSNDVEVL